MSLDVLSYLKKYFLPNEAAALEISMDTPVAVMNASPS